MTEYTHQDYNALEFGRNIYKTHTHTHTHTHVYIQEKPTLAHMLIFSAFSHQREK
jgi:hypothetical protein